MPFAIRFHQTGGPEVLRWEEVTVGDPAPGEVRVRHEAVGLNFIDTYHRMGLYPLPLPSGIGREGSGVVEAVGAGVSDFAVGDRIAYAGGPIGAIGVFPTEIPERRGEPELGYWIARPYWGQGLIPEAVEAILRRQFREIGAERVWCAHFPGNERSRRVQEKCGFRHVCDTPPSPWPDGTERPGVCQAITRQEWEVRHG